MIKSQTSGKLDLLMTNYRENLKEIWDIRSEEIHDRWKNETGDFEAISAELAYFAPETLLEVGYGYGRLAPLYRRIPTVVGVDISTEMLRMAALSNANKGFISLLDCDIRALPFGNSSFQCIIAVRTLNHVHPNDLAIVESEITRVSSKVVIVLESDKKLKGARYEFEHDYDQFLKDDFTLVKKKILEPFVYIRTYIKRQ